MTRPKQAPKPSSAPAADSARAARGRRLRRSLRWAAWIIVAVLAIGLIVFEALVPAIASHDLLTRGVTAPPIVLTDDSGAHHDVFADAGARPILIDFFDTTCDHCADEMSSICSVVSNHPEALVVGIEAGGHDANAIKQFRQTAGNGCFTGTLLVDPGRQVTQDYNVIDTPTTYLIQNGRIAAAAVGEDQLGSVVAKLGTPGPH